MSLPTYWLRPNTTEGRQADIDTLITTALADDSLTLDELLQIEGLIPSESTFSFYGDMSPLLVALDPEAAFNAQRLAYSVLPQGTEIQFVALDHPSWLTAIQYEVGVPPGRKVRPYADMLAARRLLQIYADTFQFPLAALSNGTDGAQVRMAIVPELLEHGALDDDEVASELLKLGFGLISKQSVNNYAWLVGLATIRLPRMFTPMKWVESE